MAEKYGIELVWILTTVRRWLWLILACVLVGASSAFVVASLAPPVYNASVTLLVNADPGAAASDYSAIVASERLILTYGQMLNERSIMETVVARLGLDETPEALAKRVDVTPVQETQLIRLSVKDADPGRAALIANTMAETFIAQIQALRQAREQGDVKVTIAEAARTPEHPTSRRTLYTGLAALVSGMLAMGVAFVIEYVDDTIKSPDDVRRALGLSTLGAIGRLCKGERELVVAAQPPSPAAEAFHMLCTNIRFSDLNKPLHTLLVTSPGPREGKSLIVANLAAAAAQAGLKVVAVDADLRHPRLHRLFDLDLPAEGAGKVASWGLTGSLRDGCVDGRLHSTPVESLRVLPSGELAPNPIEMIGSQRMGSLLHDLAEQADMVLVDCPPALPVADAAALASAVDGVLLVVEAGRTPREAAQHAVENLRQVKANLVGVVLNGVSARKGSYYDYKKYYRGSSRQRERSSIRQ